MANMTSILVSGISVGLLAGVVSGLFYLFLAGIRWAGRFRDVVLREVHRSSERPVTTRCTQCLSTESSLLVTRCTRCDAQGCLECTKNQPDTWLCPECRDKFSEVKQQSEVWFSNQLQRRFNKTVTTSTSLVQTREDGSRMDRTTVQVREFIEKLVEKLVSGGLDEVTVNRMYDHPEYEPLSEEESPSSTHAYLKQLIECIIREAMELPKMKRAIQKNVSNGSVSPDDIDMKTYEDILATAILNKVIDKFQQFRIDRSSNLDGNSNFLLDLKRGRPNYISCLEVGVNDSGSIEDVTVADEGSWDGSASTEPLSLRIEEHIEEIMTYSNDRDDSPNPHGTDSELDFYFSKMNFLPNHRVPFPELGMDIVDEIEDDNGDDESSEEGKLSPQPTDLLNPVDSWEQNWLFQKRRLKISSSVQSVPVPMLVPNPNEDYRAQIGDKDADEMSDLSECSEGAPADMSDFDSSDEYMKNDNLQQINKSFITAESKDISESYSELLRSDTPDGGYGGSAEEYASTHDGGSELAEATNSELFKATSVDCLSEFGQQDSEYTEDYASVTQRQLNSLLQLRDSETMKPVPKPRNVVSSTHSESEERAADTIKLSKSSESTEVIENTLATPPRPGTIAEREHKKWESAIPLPNNPYSPENINKRLQKRQYLSRSCSEASLELPESLPDVRTVKVASQPLKVVCASSELDSKRYERDYYVNVKNSTSSSTGLQPSPSVKITAPSLTGASKQKTEPNQIELVRLKSAPTRTAPNEKEASHIDLVRLKSAPTIPVTAPNEEEQPQNLHHVEAEVSRLQQEIKKTEERWYKELHSPKIESPDQKVVINTAKRITKDVQYIVTSKLNGNSCESSENIIKTSSKPQDFVKLEQLVKEGSKSVTNSCEKNKSGNNCEKPSKNLSNNCDNTKNLVNIKQGKPPISARKKLSTNSKQPTVAMDRMRTAYGYYEVFSNGSTDKKWDGRSDGSTISSDSEFSPSLPSVKELAKNFAGGTESDSSTTSKGSGSAPNVKGPDVCLATKEVVIITKKDKEKQQEKSSSRPGKQVRQIHSLTARSMSREFREGLRKNLPVQMDRNLYSAAGSDSNVRRSLSPQFPNVIYDSTTGYTSDESDTVSPIPPSRKLQDNIEFWEKMKSSK